MIENVRELHGERRPHAFRELEVLGHRGVGVPSMQASEVTRAPAILVQAQNASPELLVDRDRKSKNIVAFHVVGTDAARTGYIPI